MSLSTDAYYNDSIMHVLTCSFIIHFHWVIKGLIFPFLVTLRPSNVQASLGLRQCMAALKDMEVCLGKSRDTNQCGTYNILIIGGLAQCLARMGSTKWGTADL